MGGKIDQIFKVSALLGTAYDIEFSLWSYLDVMLPCYYWNSGSRAKDLRQPVPTSA